jgi:hypothetical protein
MINIRRQLIDATFVDHVKGNACYQAVPIIERLALDLRKWRRRWPKGGERLVFRSNEREVGDKSKEGRYPLKPALIRGGFERAELKGGGLSMRGLRHTFASIRPICAKLPLLGYLISWATPPLWITAKVYSHSVVDRVDAIPDALSNARCNTDYRAS